LLSWQGAQNPEQLHHGLWASSPAHDWQETFAIVVDAEKDVLPRHTLRDLEVVVGVSVTEKLQLEAEFQAEHEEEHEVVEHADVVELAFDCHPG